MTHSDLAVFLILAVTLFGLVSIALVIDDAARAKRRARARADFIRQTRRQA